MRLDAIGDYTLFRNFLYCLKQDKRFSSHHFILLGNKSFKTLAEGLDAEIFEKFIWIDTSILSKRTTRAALLLRLSTFAFDLLIHPVHSRCEYVDDFINEIYAKRKIASRGDSANYSNDSFEKKSSMIYDTLVEVPSHHCFEFYRNKRFIEHLLGYAVKTELSIRRTSYDRGDLKNYRIGLFPSAGAEFRRWSSANFSSLIGLVSGSFKEAIEIVILGGEKDKEILESIKKDSTSKDSPSLIKTLPTNTLVELINALTQCSILVSNETGAVHIAAALNVPTVCISNCNHIGRFNPYPSSLNKKVVTIYPNGILGENFHILVEKFKKRSDLNINEIKPIDVFSAVLELLPSKL